MPKKQQKRRQATAGNDNRTLRIAALSVVSLVVLGVVFIGAVALGNDPGTGTVTTPSPTPQATVVPSGFGPAPVLDGNVEEVFPEHGVTVRQADTRTTSPGNPQGVCVRVRFEETNGQWYRMAVNGREVTQETIWVLSDVQNPETGRLCYDPEEGLPVGMVEAAVSVQDPRLFDAPPREVVGWKFEVID